VGGVPLAGAIAALRQELLEAWVDAGNKQLRFKVAPVELTVEAQVTWTGEGNTGIKWWLIDAEAKVSRAQSTIQTIKLTLDPVTFDAQGNPVSILIDAADTPVGAAGNGASRGSESLDATDD
jgi:hypothetical protein